MKARRVFMALVIVIVLTSLLTLLAFSRTSQPKLVELYMDLTVGDVMGINVDSDALHFGTIIPGSVVAKRFSLFSDKLKMASFELQGNISEFVDAPEDVLLLTGVNTTVGLSAKVPTDAKYGEYSGKLLISFTEVR